MKSQFCLDNTWTLGSQIYSLKLRKVWIYKRGVTLLKNLYYYRDNGVKAIENLMTKKGKFDYVLLETTGLADPGNNV
jgi:hypothetical protein